MYWEARVTLGGRQTSFYADTKTEALKRARAARSDAERGRGAEATTVTVERHMLDWLDLVRPTVRDSTYQSYAGHVHTWIIPHLGRVKVIDLTPAQVRKMLSAVAEAGRSDATVVRVRATLSSALRQAQGDYGLLRNVASVAKPPQSAAPAFRREVLTVGDARNILAAFDGSRLWPLVAFAIGTGLRQGEQLALHWSEVDMEGRLIQVRYSLDGKRLVRPKSKKSARTLRLSSLALQALEAQRVQNDADRMLAGADWQEQDLVFPNPTGGIRTGTVVTHNFQARLASHDLPTIRWHALRRLCSALLQDQGVPITVVRDILGHSSLQVTEGYAYVMPAALLEAMDSLDGALEPEMN